MMNIERISSCLNLRNLGFDSQDSTCTKLGKVTAGVGVACLSLISWKFIVIGGLGYSAFKGSQYIQNRYFRGHAIRREATGLAGAVVDEALHHELVNARHDAHGDQHQADLIIQADPIADLRLIQAGVLNWHGKRALEAVITHPNVIAKGADLQWIRKMVRMHGKWSKRTLGLSLPAVQVYRKIKGCFD